MIEINTAFILSMVALVFISFLLGAKLGQRYERTKKKPEDVEIKQTRTIYGSHFKTEDQANILIAQTMKRTGSVMVTTKDPEKYSLTLARLADAGAVDFDPIDGKANTYRFYFIPKISSNGRNDKH